jgi:hypothetical protein
MLKYIKKKSLEPPRCPFVSGWAFSFKQGTLGGL